MSKQKVRSINDITAGDISLVFNKLKNNGLIFRYDFNQISKHFLSIVLEIEAFSIDFHTLVEAYLTNIKFNELKKCSEQQSKGKDFDEIYKKEKVLEIESAVQNENKFHQFICKSIFYLIKEPKEELLSLFVKASQDIKYIDETLNEIQKKLVEITKYNNIIQIQEEKPILNYYQDLNQKAKEEILNFIKNDIQDYALTNCYDNSLLSSLWNNSPYYYSYNQKYYKPKNPSDLENKFSDLPYLEFVNLHKIYKNDKSVFNEYLTDYINSNAIPFQISELLNQHHLLDIRKDIIKEALNIYQNGAKIMFANAVPTIIEGILHDICLQIGENENELLQKGFQYKLDKLHNVLKYELYYEYYAFRFRLFRNKVAHGRLTKADVDESADLLLLDLKQICQLVFSLKLKLNQKLFVIDELNKSISKPEYKYVLEYLLLDKIEIPMFYQLDKQINEVEKMINSTEFWEYLETEMDSGGDIVKHGICTILKKMRKRRSIDTRCAKIFKKAGIKDVNKELANNYVEKLTKEY